MDYILKLFGIGKEDRKQVYFLQYVLRIENHILIAVENRHIENLGLHNILKKWLP